MTFSLPSASLNFKVPNGSLSNDDGDVSKNGKKVKQQLRHVYHAFLYISLPSLHDYDVKMRNFTFCGGREHKTTTFFFFSWTLIQYPEKKSQHLIKIERGGVSARKFEAGLMHFSSDSFVAVAVVVVKSTLINYAPANVNPPTPGREISRHLRGIFRYLTSEIGVDDFSHQEQRGSGPRYFPPRWTGWNRTVHVLKTHYMKQFFFLLFQFWSTFLNWFY